MIIEEDNLSLAWARAFLKVYNDKEDASLIVNVIDIGHGEPLEISEIRKNLYRLLESRGRPSCDTVVRTIFPLSLWNPKAPRKRLYKRYRNILPRLRKYNGNRNGLYFERLIAYSTGRDKQEIPFNQLEHIIRTWYKGNHRRSALKASIFDPFTDHTHQRQRGFPCLQQVSFSECKKGMLAVTGVYATQDIVDKAYGNYVGLHRLGMFMAQEMGLKLDRLTCIATPAVRGRTNKSQLREIADLAGVVLL